MTSRRAFLHAVQSDSLQSPARPLRVPAEDRGPGFIPRGMRRPEAAFYVGVSTTKFDDWIARGMMPQPKEEGGVVVWDRRALDEAFDALPDRAPKKKADPFGEVAT